MGGLGVGSALLQWGLDQAARDSLPCFLEASESVSPIDFRLALIQQRLETLIATTDKLLLPFLLPLVNHPHQGRPLYERRGFRVVNWCELDVPGTPDEKLRIPGMACGDFSS